MLTRYADQIKIIPAYAVDSISEDTVTLKNGYTFDELDTLNSVRPTEEAERSDAGTLFNFSFSVGVEKFTDAQKQKYGSSPMVILVLYKITGSTVSQVAVGSKPNPTQMIWTPYPEYDQLDFSRSSIFAVL